MTTEERFGADHASRYDEGVRLSVPGYDELHRMTRYLLRSALGDSARVLVVGSGTGEEATGLAAEEPGWRVTGVDPSPDMTRVARHRLASANLTDRVALHTGLLQDLPAETPYDAATSLLVAHFLPDDDSETGKLALLREVAVRLKPGAPLVLADLHGDPASPAFAHLLSAWRLRQLAHGVRADNLETTFREVMRAVHFVSEARIAALLREAGFGEPQRFYGALLFGGWISRKATPDHRI